MKPQSYIDLVQSEIRHRAREVPYSTVDTIYFGGGTPSLIEADLIVSVLDQLAKWGFRTKESCEITLEINPATVDEKKLRTYLAAGINRFSVGAQTFNDRLLKICGREHTAQQTWDTLDLLRSHQLNYSFDLLFALPTQTCGELQEDLERVQEYAPPHLSAYCLTLPQGHSMEQGRPKEETQVRMFEQIESQLAKVGLKKYEISNFARPGFESQHNLIYWTDEAYWGLGLSAHSYFPHWGWGRRFWNPKNLRLYTDQIQGDRASLNALPQDQVEDLAIHEALTDFCHTHLRLSRGLDINAVSRKFGSQVAGLAFERIQSLLERGLLHQPYKDGRRVTLTATGEVLNNQVLRELTFLETELSLRPPSRQLAFSAALTSWNSDPHWVL